jgi:transformation/transcription domain-associated protein
MIPLAPHIRMVQDDPSYISLQGIFEDHCRQSGLVKDDPVLFTMDKMRILAETKTAVSDDRSYFKNSNSDIHSQKHPDHGLNARMEIFSAIQDKWVPHTIALDYVKASYPQYSDFWLFRRHFSYQYAALTFMTYVLFMNNRYPHKLNISRSTGNVWGSELLASMASAKPTFHNPEPVPFRLTPNLQTLMGPMATEGIFTIAIMAIARSLTEPEFDLEQQLSLFVRDEMIFWFTSSHRAGSMAEGQLRDTVQMNSEIIVKRALSLAQAPLGMLPANQTVIDLVAKAVNPMYLAQADALWMPYL